MHLWIQFGRLLNGVLNGLIIIDRLAVALDRDLLLHACLTNSVLLHFVLIGSTKKKFRKISKTLKVKNRTKIRKIN